MANQVSLRDVQNTDLEVFFEHQLDKDANYMAACTAKDPADKKAFMAHWGKILADETISIQTIIFDDAIVGNISSHKWFGEPEVSYWISKECWGKGIATDALNLFLARVSIRPLYARVVKDNAGSKRVLEKCGFTLSSEDKGFAEARGEEVEELIFVLQRS
ncbi:GNAT family N-acetyltransferase [soil metagenome]